MLITIPVARLPLLFRIDYISLVWIINWAVFPTRQYKFQPTLCLQRIKELFQMIDLTLVIFDTQSKAKGGCSFPPEKTLEPTTNLGLSMWYKLP